MRGKKREIEYINVNEIYIHSCLLRNPFTLYEALHQISHLQAALEHFGDNSPNVVAQTETFVPEIFSCKMN